MSRFLDPKILDFQIRRFLDFKISRLYILEIHGSRCSTGMYKGLEDTTMSGYHCARDRGCAGANPPPLSSLWVGIDGLLPTHPPPLALG